MQVVPIEQYASRGRTRTGQVCEALREMLTKNYRPGSRLPSERQLARDHHVSPVTVARALHELTREGVVHRIPGQGTFVCDDFLSGSSAATAAPVASAAPAGSARGTAASGIDRSAAESTAVPITGVIAELPDWGSLNGPDRSVRHQTISRIESIVQQAGGRAYLSDANDPSIDVKSTVREMLQSDVNSFVVIKGEIEIDDPWLIELTRLRASLGIYLPIVVSASHRLNDWPVDLVRNGAGLGIIEATNHLLDLGHKKIAFFAADPAFYWMEERLNAFKYAMRVAGHSVSEDDIFVGPPQTESPASYWPYASSQVAKDFFAYPHGHTAVVGANDDMGIALMREAAIRGLRIPEDISVTGYDDLIDGKRHRLTTVTISSETIAESITHRLMQRLNGDDSAGFIDLVVAPRLLIRSSTAAPSSGLARR